MPGLLLIVDAKFILYPAFFHKKKMLFKSYNNLKTKNINPWIVMIKNNDNYFFEIYEKSEFFEINNQLSQKIKFYNHKKINIRDYNLYKPIN